MRIAPLLILLLSFSAITFAQDLSFESVIREAKSGDPVPDALVSIEGTVLATRTDEKGVFVFTDPVPEGSHPVTVVKEGFETKYFLIRSLPNVKIVIDFVEVELTRKEALKRKKEKIALAKEEKRLLKVAKEENDDQERKLAREIRRLKRKNSVDVEYDSLDDFENPVVEIKKPVVEEDVITSVDENGDSYSEAQIKYAKVLGVTLDKMSNKDLYSEIDKWMGTPYLWGGETKAGIDCSSFSQLLLMRGFDLYIERTSEKQFESKNTYKFTGVSHLVEGDLLFFKGVEGQEEVITHVGVYLHNNKFVHATGSRYNDGIRGVKISDITDPYWLNKFVSGGRRIGN